MNLQGKWGVVLLLVLGIRFATLFAYPLHDTTEARYADIARIMVSTNEWLVPQIAPGVPFWGKPPLSIWSTAISFKIFGQTEFAARFPAFLFILGSIILVYYFCARRHSVVAGLAACVVFTSSGLGFVGAGAVMTDAALTFAVTISVMSFSAHMSKPSCFTAYLFFVGLALGLLAKGPVAVVLVGIPVLLWSLWCRRLAWLWRSLPWIKGSALLCLLALPWYLAAENASPGFLEYFLVGEHFNRFLDSGWEGDLYGNAHDRPIGTIWLYGLIGLLPWSFIAGSAAAFRIRSAAGVRPHHSGAGLSNAFTAHFDKAERQFLILATLSPLLLFTVAGNVLPAYVMPSLAPFSVLLGRWLQHGSFKFAYAGAVIPVLVTLLFVSGVLASFDNRSQKSNLVSVAEKQFPSPIYYYGRMPHSASFYSNGTTLLIPDRQELKRVLSEVESGTVLVKTKRERDIDRDSRSCLNLENIHGDYAMYSIVDCASDARSTVLATSFPK